MPFLLRISTSLVILAVLATPTVGTADEEVKAATAAVDLEAMFEALQKPDLAGELPLPERLELGRAEIQPRPGARLLALSAAGRPCGVLLDGPATWTYRVERHEYLPYAERALKKAKGVEVEQDDGGLLVRGELTGAAVWGWSLVDRLGAPQSVEPAPLPRWLTDALGLRLGANPGRDLLLDRFNGDSDSFHWALLHGSKDDFVLDVDARPAVLLEVLARLDEIHGGGLDGRLASETLSRQPIERSWQKPGAIEFLSRSTELTVKSPARRQLEVSAKIRFESLRDGLVLLPLSLSSRIFDEDDDEHPYTLRSLTVDGQRARWVHHNGSLLVLLPKPLGTGDTVTLDVETHGRVIVPPRGDKYWRLTSWSWYPKPSSGGQELSTFDIRVETRPPFVPIAPGKLIERSASAEVHRVVTRLEVPVGSAYVAAGEYSTIAEEQDGDTIYTSAYNFDKEVESKRLAQIMFAIRGCFENWFGVDYPFADLQVVEINQWGWGQAPPGIVFLTREAFLSRARARADPQARENAWMRRSLDARIAHELAHAWFPHVAKVWRGEENWLSESLADYTAAGCLSSLLADRPGMARRLFDTQLGEWKESSKTVKDGSVFFAGYLPNDLEGRRSRYRLLYGRGPLALHAIRLRLQESKGQEEGERLFLSWIRSYVNIFQYKQAETRHLVALLERLTGDDWKPFFDRHIYGTEHVEIDG